MLKDLDLILQTVNKQQKVLIRGPVGSNVTVTPTRMDLILRNSRSEFCTLLESLDVSQRGILQKGMCVCFLFLMDCPIN